ncbi:hypothetical protein [Castellaniella sp. GW247-6E4]|uniref:DUF6925 family protein n=1 Tax=Castellaniella sp. GW247-6E4 TaxID=3140380 RepID=UPI003315F6DD
MSDITITALVEQMIVDARHGWSIGTFGAIGEFMRDDEEPASISLDAGACRIVTSRGGMRVTPVPALQVIAYDTLASDGETWGQAIAFCLPKPDQCQQSGVRDLGPDREALRHEDRDMRLFDLGVGIGHVRFCVRTEDIALIAQLEALDGRPIFGPGGQAVMTEVLRAQPHRVLFSPIGRIEVYAPIPAPGGNSPEGPHTHLLPKLLAAGRTHAANAPIPIDLQPVLMLHPRSPWRDGGGRRVPFDRELDEIFQRLLRQFGLPEDIAIRIAIEDAVERGVSPQAYLWPETRRGRIAARIVLRRLACAGQPVAAWRRHYDHAAELESDDEAVLHG